jgi:sulfur carrier protein ThiS
MAKVTVQLSGGNPELKKAQTVGQLKEMMDAEEYAATVNGEPVEDDYELSQYEFVSLTPAVKAGAV